MKSTGTPAVRIGCNVDCAFLLRGERGVLAFGDDDIDGEAEVVKEDEGSGRIIWWERVVYWDFILCDTFPSLLGWA